MSLAKLDVYDYELLDNVIRIRMHGTKDPTMVDILSEIDRYRGRVYVEGRYFTYLDSEVVTQRHPGAPVYLDLYVKTEENRR